MNNDASNVGGVPLALRVTDPVLWLEHNDRDPELHETIEHLMRVNRHAEAALCLRSYIGRTAPVRAQVDGWDGPWAWAVAVVAHDVNAGAIHVALDLLKTTVSIPREKG